MLTENGQFGEELDKLGGINCYWLLCLNLHRQSNNLRNDGMNDLKLLTLETLTVNDGWTGFIIFLLGDPHGLEGG